MADDTTHVDVPPPPPPRKARPKRAGTKRRNKKSTCVATTAIRKSPAVINLCANNVFTVFVGRDNSVFGTMMDIATRNMTFAYFRTVLTFESLSSIPPPAKPAGNEVINIPNRLTAGAVEWLRVATVAHAYACDTTSSVLVASGTHCGCTIRAVGSCKVLFVGSCSFSAMCSIDQTSDVIDPLLALIAAEYLDADTETLSLLTAAFVWHFVGHCDAACSRAVETELVDTVCRAVQGICNTEERSKSQLPAVYVDCLRCLLLKDCAAAARLAAKSIWVDRIVSLYPVCDAINVPDAALARFPIANVLVEDMFTRLYHFSIDPANVMVVGSAVLCAVDNTLTATPPVMYVVSDVVEPALVPLRNEVLPKESDSPWKAMMFKSCHRKIECVNNVQVVLCMPSRRCTHRATTGNAPRGHALDSLNVPYITGHRFAYHPGRKELYGTLQAIASVFISKQALDFDSEPFRGTDMIKYYLPPHGTTDVDATFAEAIRTNVFSETWHMCSSDENPRLFSHI